MLSQLQIRLIRYLAHTYASYITIWHSLRESLSDEKLEQRAFRRNWGTSCHPAASSIVLCSLARTGRRLMILGWACSKLCIFVWQVIREQHLSFIHILCKLVSVADPEIYKEGFQFRVWFWKLINIHYLHHNGVTADTISTYVCKPPSSGQRQIYLPQNVHVVMTRTRLAHFCSPNYH